MKNCNHEFEIDKYFEDGQNKIEVNPQNAQFWVDVLWGN